MPKFIFCMFYLDAWFSCRWSHIWKINRMAIVFFVVILSISYLVKISKFEINTILVLLSAAHEFLLPYIHNKLPPS